MDEFREYVETDFPILTCSIHKKEEILLHLSILFLHAFIFTLCKDYGGTMMQDVTYKIYAVMQLCT